MKHIISAAILVCAAGSTHAGLPVGTFGHEFTEPANEAVWTVKAAAQGFDIVRHGDKARLAGSVMTADQRKAFWDRMWWDGKTLAGAACIGAKAEVFCYVPAATRKSIADLSDNKSDFFHFDEVGGLMEIKQLKSPVK